MVRAKKTNSKNSSSTSLRKKAKRAGIYKGSNAVKGGGVSKKDTKEKSMNPFDLRYIKQKKTPVVGKSSHNGNISRNMKVAGRPVESKAKSDAIRRQTFTNLLEKESKSNQFDDRRIGAGSSAKFGSNSAALSGRKSTNDESVFEDMMFKKFTLQRQKLISAEVSSEVTGRKTPKKRKSKPKGEVVSKYQLVNQDDSDDGLEGLGESVELTHLGQSIGEMERFEAPTAAVLSDDDDVGIEEDKMFKDAMASDDKNLTLKGN